MAVDWIVLPKKWGLSNVQAVLTFLINLLCAVGIWIFSYTAWKIGAVQAARRPGTKLLSLLSLNGPGDVMDSIPLLRSDIGPALLTKIVAQCFMVLVLTVIAIISGPIARFSTRTGTTLKQLSVPGWRATPAFTEMNNAFVQWNSTIERLKSAQFPDNQLLDFLPNNQVDWKHGETEWNSTWAAVCNFTAQTPLNLTTTGNYTGSRIFDEVPGIAAIFPPEQLHNPKDTNAFTSWHSSTMGRTIVDSLIFVLIQPNPRTSYDNATEDYTNDKPMDITLACFHLHNFTSIGANSTANFGVGPVESAAYTMASCNLHRAPGHEANVFDGAFPWTLQSGAIIDSISEFHQALLEEQSFTNRTIYHPSGQDLFRWYQAYMVSKDTQNQLPVERILTVRVATVELAVVAVAVLTVYAGVLVGALALSLLVWRMPRETSIPMTKVEWIMQVIREVNGREVGVEYLETPWSHLRPDLRNAVYGRYGEDVGPQGRSYRTFHVMGKSSE